MWFRRLNGGCYSEHDACVSKEGEKKPIKTFDCKNVPKDAAIITGEALHSNAVSHSQL